MTSLGGSGLQRAPNESDDDAVAVIDFVLDDLRGPAGEGGVAGAEPTVLVVDLDTSITQCAAFAGQGQASFLGVEGTVRSGDHGVEHHRYTPAKVFIHEDDDAFAYANHVGGHAHAP